MSTYTHTSSEIFTCTGCGAEKPLSGYRIQKKHRRLASGEVKTYSSRLKRCIECLRRDHKRWRDANPERVQHWSDMSRVRPYGLSLEDYDRLWDAQQGCCGICREPEVVKEEGCRARSLAVDHDHVTGEIRGLLCNSCNLGLGKFKDDLALLDAASAYLRERVQDA